MKSQISQMVRTGCPASGVRKMDFEPSSAFGPVNLHNLRGLEAVKKLLDNEEWTCLDGKTYRIYPWEDGVWKCVRTEGVQGWRSVTIWYDKDRDVVWWGEKKRYYFNPTCPGDEPGKINWLCVGGGNATARIRFSLYADAEAARDAKHQANCTSSGLSAAFRESEDFRKKSHDAESTAASSYELRLPFGLTAIQPPPGLGPPSGPRATIAMEHIPCKSHEAWQESLDRRNLCDDSDTTSIGFSDSCSVASWETANETGSVVNGEKAETASSAASTLSAEASTFVPILSLPARVCEESDWPTQVAAHKDLMAHAHDFDMDARSVGSGSVGNSSTGKGRTPLTAKAKLFTPGMQPGMQPVATSDAANIHAALPFMAASDVAKAWERQGYERSRAANASARSSASASSAQPLQPGPLQPGEQSKGTAAAQVSRRNAAQRGHAARFRDL